MNLKQRIAAFLRGRYGVDRLGVFTVFLSLLLMFINSFVHSFVLLIIQSAVMGYWIFRCFSKNILARQRENQIFEKYLTKFISFFKLQRFKWRSRKTHVFTKCPKCKVNIRLPRNKGEHGVRCPKCGNKFNFICK